MTKLFSVLALLSPVSVFAAVPADITTALTDTKADAITVATAVLVVIVAIFAFKLMRKAL